jgi:hypothetical protein
LRRGDHIRRDISYPSAGQGLQEGGDGGDFFVGNLAAPTDPAQPNNTIVLKAI